MIGGFLLDKGEVYFWRGRVLRTVMVAEEGFGFVGIGVIE